MAVNRKDKTTSILIMVQTGTDAKGVPTYSTRVIAGVNPDITDDDAFAIGKSLAMLQKHTLGAIERSDKAKLADT